MERNTSRAKGKVLKNRYIQELEAKENLVKGAKWFDVLEAKKEKTGMIKATKMGIKRIKCYRDLKDLDDWESNHWI